MQTAAVGSVRGLSLLALKRSRACHLLLPSTTSRPSSFGEQPSVTPSSSVASRGITSAGSVREHNRATAREMDLHHALNDACRRLIPPLTSESYKGSQGKVLVVGGCLEYTGAPYLAAMSSLKVGSDMAYVVCMDSAAQVIKTYSPELIVLPYLPQAGGSVDAAMARITPWLERTSVIVVGPGLGDDPLVNQAAHKVVEAARAMNKPLLVDGSGINIIVANPGLVRGYTNCILTPNINELGRLATAVGVKLEGPMGVQWQKHTQDIAAALGGVTVVSKGPSDLISNGSQTVRCQVPSALRRSAGQGDVLAGTTAAFMCWAAIRTRVGTPPSPVAAPASASAAGSSMLACAYGGCLVMRTASYAAFQEVERSMLAGDVMRHLHLSFKQLFGDHF